MSRVGAEKSNFTLTCSRLSQYLKEKGSFPDLSLAVNRTYEPKVDHEPPRTMNLLPGLEPSGENGAGKSAVTAEVTARQTATMTIFYGGRVTVFDSFPEDTAKELFAMIRRGCPAPAGNAPPRDLAAPSSVAVTAAAVQPQKAVFTSNSDLPIARRVSLNRFLVKRKDRISSKAPYQLHSPADAAPASPKKADIEQPWLALAPSKLERSM